MASTSTNKQPLLVDRVFSQTKDLSGKFIPPGVGIDLQSGSQGELILDCTKNDGAVIEDIIAFSRGNLPKSYLSEADRKEDIDNGNDLKQQTLGYVINLYLCPSTTYLDPANAFFIGSFDGGTAEGSRTMFWGMPHMHAPVAHLGSTNQGIADVDPDAYAGVTPTYMQGQYVPKGQCLWAAVNQLILPPDDDGNPVNDGAIRAPILQVQGGYF